MYVIKIFTLFLIFFLNILSANNNIILTNEEKQFIKNNPIVKVGAERDWAPFDFVENGVYKGIAKDYLDLIEERTSLNFSYEIDSWDSLLTKTKNNQIQLLPILAKTKKREKYLLYTNNYLTIRDYIFALDETIINDENDFKNKTIVVVKGYTQEDHIKKKYPKTNLLIVNTLLESIDAIHTKKADFLISNIVIMNYLTKKHNLLKLDSKFFFNYSGNILYMATNKNSSILNNIIKKALNSISYNEKNIIFTKWIGKTTTTKVNYFSIEENNYINKTEKLIIANELAYKPYDYNENGIPKGYVVDYMKLLFSKIGIEVVFKADSWSSLINGFKEKEIDILPLITKSEKREKYINFTKSYLNQQMSIITKKSNNSLINIDDLNGKTIALAKNWNMTKFVKKYHPKIKVIEYKTVKDFLEAVANNYVDATILDKLSANYYIKSGYKDKLHITGTAEINNFNPKIHMGVHKNKAILKDILEKGIFLISEDEQKALNNKWINSSKGIDFSQKELEFIKNTIVTSSISKNWAPFAYSHKGKSYGLGFDFWNLIADKANLKTKNLIANSFSKELNLVREQKIDVLVTTSKTKDREEFAIFSDKYFKAPIGIATLKDKNYISSAKELIGKKVAVGRNYSAHKLLKEAYPSIDFVPVNGIIDALELLSKDEVFAVVDIMPVLNHNIKTKGYSNIKITGVTGVDFSMSILIRKDYKLLQSIINKVLKNITPYERELIYNKWLNIEFQEAFDYSLIWKITAVFLLVLAFVLYKNNELLRFQKKLKNTTSELENSLRNFKTLLDLSVAGIIIIRNKKIVYINNELLNIFKYKKSVELMRNDLSMIFQEKDINTVLNNINKSFDIKGLTKKKDKIPLLVTSRDIIYDNLPSHIISIIDLTDIKNKEAIILQQSKLASLGEMIGNIAHQWRQPLSSISTTASGIKLQKEFGLLDDKMFEESIDSITLTTQYLSQTIDDFQNYMKKDKMKQKFHIEHCINTALSIMKGSLHNHFIKVELNIEDVQIYTYENELNQALLNILNNSKDALCETSEDERFIYINTSIKDNNLLIEVIDTAGGIPSKIMKKVFEPYFTTKHKSQGTGLGLYMTHKIIHESLKGSIDISNIKYKTHNKCAKATIILGIT